MKSFDETLAFMKEWDGAFDGRDIRRFVAFVPFDRLSEAGLVPEVPPEEWGEVKPWTEEAVLAELRDDARFGLAKAEAEKFLSSAAMFFVVNMWCHLLENGLNQEYNDSTDESEALLRSWGTDYGKSFFVQVLDHYGWTMP